MEQNGVDIIRLIYKTSLKIQDNKDKNKDNIDSINYYIKKSEIITKGKKNEKISFILFLLTSLPWFYGHYYTGAVIPLFFGFLFVGIAGSSFFEFLKFRNINGELLKIEKKLSHKKITVNKFNEYLEKIESSNVRYLKDLDYLKGVMKLDDYKFAIQHRDDLSDGEFRVLEKLFKEFSENSREVRGIQLESQLISNINDFVHVENR